MKKKNILPVLCTILMAVGAVPANAGNIDEAGTIQYLQPARSFAAGTGTEEDPYQISNAAELALMAGQITDEEDIYGKEYETACYVLTEDIVLNDFGDRKEGDAYEGEYSWKPADNVMYTGTFDGNGHSIRGMYIHTEAEDIYHSYGLFGQINGTVKNLTVSDSYIAVSGLNVSVGGIVGSGVFLTAESDAVPGNAPPEEAVLILRGCKNSGKLWMAEETEYENYDGEQLYKNYLGEIIGNWCGEDEYSVFVDE